MNFSICFQKGFANYALSKDRKHFGNKHYTAGCIKPGELPQRLRILAAIRRSKYRSPGFFFVFKHKILLKKAERKVPSRFFRKII